MQKLKLHRALKSLLEKTHAGEVEWQSISSEEVRAKLGSLWITVSKEGDVRIMKHVDIENPPYQVFRSKFEFVDRDRGPRIYHAAVKQQEPESVEMLIDKMLGGA